MMMAILSPRPSSLVSSSMRLLKWYSSTNIIRRAATNGELQWTAPATSHHREARRHQQREVPSDKEDFDRQQADRRRQRETAVSEGGRPSQVYLQSATECYRSTRRKNRGDISATMSLEPSKKGSAAALMSATSQHRRQQKRQQQPQRVAPGHIVNPSIDVSLPVDHAAVENEAFLGERKSHGKQEQESAELVVEEKSSRIPAVAFATVGIGAAIVGSGILPF